MFFHFSIIMLIFKKKGELFDQKSYDNLFYCIENNLRELGFGDVSVNKKMKDLNKILYDILLKVDLNEINNKKDQHISALSGELSLVSAEYQAKVAQVSDDSHLDQAYKQLNAKCQ